jgi:hypothetical protein
MKAPGNAAAEPPESRARLALALARSILVNALGRGAVELAKHLWSALH